MAGLNLETVDNLQLLGTVNSTVSTDVSASPMTTTATASASSTVTSLKFLASNISTFTSESISSLYPVDEVIYSNLSRSRDNDCLGCNASGFEVLNVSTTVFPTRINDNGDSSNQDELYEVPLSMIIFLSLLYGGISVSALIGNTLVLWVVTVSRRMRTVTNMFIANLALADIIIGLFTIPFQFQAAVLQRWNLPDFMCAFCPFVQVLSVNVSVFTLSAIAVDRYRAVLHPLSARVSKRKATWAILSIWAVGFILALPTELDYKVTHIEDKGETKPFCANLGLPPAFRMYYSQGIVVIQYFFPLIIITGAYVHMGMKLWGATAPGNKEESRDAVVLRNKKKVIKMLALVVLMFGLCWLPLQTYNFLTTFVPSINEYQYINVLWFGFHSLAMSNSCCNPFIYAIYNDKFQREFQFRLRCLRRCAKNGDDNTYSEGSDFDRSKIRASYRFTNNRLGSSVTNRSFYNHTTRTNIVDSRSTSFKANNLVLQTNRCMQREYNSECQGNTRYLGVGTYTFRNNNNNQQQSSQASHSNHNNNHHNQRHRRHRRRHNGNGSSEGSERNNSSSSSSGTFTNDVVAELAGCGNRFVNGDLREGTNGNYFESSSNFETDMNYQETSLTVTMNSAVNPEAVGASKGKVVTNGNGCPLSLSKVVAKDGSFKV